MHSPDLLTETDFLRREFPVPANPQRPLALISPRPDEDRSTVAQRIGEIAQRGFGGLVLDPALFGPGFLGEAWFELVGIYVEACRLVGLYLWLLDGFTLGPALAPILEEAHAPGWRGREITALRCTVQGPARVDLPLAEPTAGRLLVLLARSLERREAPVNLLPHLTRATLGWEVPPGRWEICRLWAAPAAGPPAAGFNWAAPSLISAWLRLGYDRYRELFGPHLGRTIQGFYALCPSWPAGDGWPLLSAADPNWSELAGLLEAPGEAESYFLRVAANLTRSYLLPLREWCWRHHLRLAGYRMGGRPIPGTTTPFDLGGLPDLAPGAAPDLAELAGLAGLARHHGQERIACQLSLSGNAGNDRAALGRLASAGADLFLLRAREDAPSQGELALNDYAARLSMAVAAGSPAAPETLTVRGTPAALHTAGQEALALTLAGRETVCLPAAEGSARLADAEIAATSLRPILPTGFSLRVRAAENWTLYTVFNHGENRWRGPLRLPAAGAAEIWLPATGEQRPADALTTEGGGFRIPLALEPGEAAVVIAHRSGIPRRAGPSQLILAHLPLGRRWRFAAAGGNILPLHWREQAPGCWRASFTALTLPDEICLADKPGGAACRLNGSSLDAGEGNLPLPRLSAPGENELEITGVSAPPQAYLTGDFICRGPAVAAAPEEIAGPWTLNGYPYFAGPGVYRQTVQVPAALIRPDLAAWLEIEALAGTAAVRLNGEPAGFLPWPPYRLDLGPADRLRPGPNLLEIEIDAPADAPAWALKGLLGEVSLLIGEMEPETVDPFAEM